MAKTMMNFLLLQLGQYFRAEGIFCICVERVESRFIRFRSDLGENSNLKKKKDTNNISAFSNITVSG